MKEEQNLFRQMQRGKNKKGVAILILATLLIGIYVCTSSVNRAGEALIFSTEEWDSQPSRRIYMIESLLQDYNGLAGMKKNDVMALLGENTYTESKERYLVGHGKGGAPGIIMTLYFDQNEVCTGFVLTQGGVSLYQYHVTQGETEDSGRQGDG